MIHEELIINGEAVDLATGVAVTLEYVNNLLGAIDKISASHSYTIKLPHTVRNERILDYPGAAHASALVGRYIPAEYRRNGITIVRNGRAYISAVTPSEVSVCLLWDGFAALSEWISNGAALSDLAFGDFVWQRGFDTPTAYKNTIVRAVYDTGVAASIMPPPPCVNVAALFTSVMNGTGTRWRIDVDGMRAEMERLVLPLMTREGTVQPLAGGVWSGVNADTPDENENGLIYITPTGKNDGLLQTSGTLVEVPGNFASVSVSIAGEWTISALAEGADAELGTDPSLRIYTAGGALLEEEALVLVNDRTAKINTEITLVTPQSFRVAIYADNGDVQGLAGTGSITVVPTLETATPGGAYDLAANMPNISQINFIKAVCYLFGAQVLADADGTIVFTSVDSYYSRTPVDWSDKIVNYDGAPTKIAFTVGSFARKNWLKYKEDSENNGTSADGAFYVDNDTIKAENTAATLPFAATRGNKIEHYTAKYDESTQKWSVEDKSVTPRILHTYTTADNRLGARFESSQTFPAVLSRWYTGLQTLLRHPVEISVYARLTEADLAGLDLTCPVYLRQTGAAYIIKGISTDSSTDICELSLIQL